jgi:predicted aspartyl protease
VGTFYVKCEIENPAKRTRSLAVQRLLVDTGSECTWIPERALEKLGIQREKKDVAFVMANGEQITRTVGFAIIRMDRRGRLRGARRSSPAWRTYPGRSQSDH